MEAALPNVAKRLLKSRIKTYLYNQPDAPEFWEAAKLLEETLLKNCEKEWRDRVGDTNQGQNSLFTSLYNSAAAEVRLLMVEHGGDPVWLDDRLGEYRQRSLKS